MTKKEERKYLQERLGLHCGQMSKAKRKEAAEKLEREEAIKKSNERKGKQ